VTTRSIEGADVIPPPRDLPYYNLRTTLWSLENAYRLRHDKNLHLAVFDRDHWDGAVRAEYFHMTGIFTEEERDAHQAVYLSRFNRALFDLSVFLMVDVEVALMRKFGPDHRSKGVYGASTNPDALTDLYEAHRRVWERFDCANDPKLLWVYTSTKTPEEVAELVKNAAVEAFLRRGESP
jgi:hypothetical protein